MTLADTLLSLQVNGVTECALAPGDAKTYTFQATEYGTSWYHSHFSAQYGDGIVGAMQSVQPQLASELH
jgi:FtsP/CotA-like multicopper oxidase with cupredoxin domain